MSEDVFYSYAKSGADIDDICSIARSHKIKDTLFDYRMEVAIILLVVIILGVTILVWYSMRKDPIKDRLITIAKIWGGIAVFILMIWFLVEGAAGWLFALLCFGAFFSEAFLKK